MKRSEIEIGKVYAHSRNAEPTRSYEVAGFVVENFDPVKDWRGNVKQQEVNGRFTDDKGNPKPDAPLVAVSLRRLIGDFLPIKHDLEIRAKNKEIAELNKRIKAKEMEQMIEDKHALISERLKVSRWDLRSLYDGRATLTLNTEQLRRLAWDLERLARLDKQAELDEQARIQKAYEETQVA